MATKGFSARGPISCSARASASLPVPDLPSSSTGTETEASRSTCRQTFSIASSAVRMSRIGLGRGWAASRWFSSSSSRRRSARASTVRRSAKSAGFSQKS